MNIFNEGTKSNYDSKLSCKFIRYLFVVQYTDGGFWVFSLCDSHVGFLFVPIYFHKLLQVFQLYTGYSKKKDRRHIQYTAMHFQRI